MVTTVTRETETNAAVVSAPAAEAAAASTLADSDVADSGVDISGVPETPAALLKEWEVSRRPLIHTVVATALVRIWDAITGPGMTDRDRVRREIAEFNGHTRGRILGPGS